MGSCIFGTLAVAGRPPLVIANGGSSGLFPDQTGPAYSTALRSSVDGTLLLCDLQLTKDFKGICRTGLDLTASTVLNLDPGRLDFNLTTYEVNGQAVRGVFSVDLTFKQINETGPGEYLCLFFMIDEPCSGALTWYETRTCSRNFGWLGNRSGRFCANVLNVTLRTPCSQAGQLWPHTRF